MAKLRVFFATNRNHQPDNKLLVFGPHFNPDGVAALRFGHVDFDAGPAEPKLESVFVYPDIKGETDIAKTGGGQFLEDLRKAMAVGPRSDTLVFIHGFNVSFNSALLAGAHLAREVAVGGKAVNVVVFSWPSDGAATPLMSYYSDREDARASGPAVARAFLKLRDFLVQLDPKDYCLRCLHLLAHSMGAYVLRQGLQALIAKDADSLTRAFDQIILAAPDEDDDAFEADTKLKLLPRLGRQVTVYFNPNDKALLISDKTKANPDRLGSDGPRLVDLIPKKVVLVDCRTVAGHANPFIEHSYYINSRAMAQDIGAVLNGDLPEAIANREFIDRLRAYRIRMELTPAPPV
ncbi:MAG: hypothetical protein JWQ29_2329 [Phenylobacterium sp.]|nr:hypothetical protein [Phenylobacterium sp.]